MFISKRNRSKWPARWEFDRSSRQSGQTLSVDRPLFSALTSMSWFSTVEPRYNEPLYNEVLSIANYFLYPSNSKMYWKRTLIQQILGIANKLYQSLGPSLCISQFQLRPGPPRGVLRGICSPCESQGWGHLQILCCPGARHFANPRANPKLLIRMRFPIRI